MNSVKDENKELLKDEKNYKIKELPKDRRLHDLAKG
jgi:hypothetical protein